MNKNKENQKKEALDFFEFFYNSTNPLYDSVKSSLRRTIQSIKNPVPFKTKKRFK